MFGRTGPWDVEHVIVWRDNMLKPDPAAEYRRQAKAAEEGEGEFAKLTKREKLNLQKTYEQMLSIRQRREIEAGVYHSKADCDRHRLQQIMEVRSRLMEIPRSMAGALAGLTAEAIGLMLDRAVRAILDEFAGEATPAGPGGDDGQ